MNKNEIISQFLLGELLESNHELQWREYITKPWIVVTSGSLEQVSQKLKYYLNSRHWDISCYRIIKKVQEIKVINIHEEIVETPRSPQ